MLTFTVFGVAVPKGSTRAFIPKGWSRPIITSDNPANKGWQQLVAEGANRAIFALPASERGVLQGPVRLSIAFYLPRPKSAPKQVILPTKKPDLDKLVRSVKDALTQVVWRDDSQVVDLVVTKRYAVNAPPHVDIVVEETAAVAPLAREQPLFEAAR